MTEISEANSTKFAEIRGRALQGFQMNPDYTEAFGDVLALVEIAEAAQALASELPNAYVPIPQGLAMREQVAKAERFELASARLAEALTKVSSVLVGGVVDGG